MVRLKHSNRLTASTLIENIIALAIISICVSLTLVLIGQQSILYNKSEVYSWFSDVTELSKFTIPEDSENNKTTKKRDGVIEINSTSNHRIIRPYE